MTIGERVRQMRTELKMSQRDLAGPDFTAAFISQIERGIISPSLRSLRVIAARLDKPVSFFLEEDEGKKEQEFDLLLYSGRVYLARSQPEEAGEAFEQALQAAQDLNDERRRADAHKGLGLALAARGDVEGAQVEYRRGIEICESLNDGEGVAWGYYHLGASYHQRGQYTQAMEYYRRSLERIEEAGVRDVGFRVCVLGSLGNCHYRVGETEQGIRFHEQALEMAERLSDFGTAADGLMGLGLIYREMGDVPHALHFCRKGLELAEILDSIRWVADVENNIGIIMAGKGKWEDAITHFRQSLQLHHLIGCGRGEAHALTEIASYHYNKGDLQQALEQCQTCLGLVEKVNDEFETARVYHVLGLIYKRQEKWDKSEEYLTRASALFSKLKVPLEVATICYELGELLTEKGCKEEALQYYQQSASLLQDLASAAERGDTPERIFCRLSDAGPRRW